MLFLLNLCWVVPPALAHSLVVRQLNQQQGLPQNAVNDLVQDQSGFIWVSTDAGLARYDGQQFKVFNKKNGYHFTDSDSILWLYADPQGYLWLVTRDNEIVQYDSRLDQFRPLTGLDQTGPLNFIHALLRLGDTLWFNANGYLYRYDLKAQRLSQAPVDAGTRTDSHSRWLHVNEQIYLLSRTVLYLFEPTSGKLTKLLSDNDNKPLIQIMAADQQVRIVSADSLWCFAGATMRPCGKHAFDYGLLAKSQLFSAILADQDGQYWFGVYGSGLYQLYADLSVQRQHQMQPEVPQTLPGNDISALMFDQQQNLWSVPYGMGLAVISPNARRIVRYAAGQNGGLSHPHVQALYQQNPRHLWVGTYNGLNRIDLPTGNVQTFLRTPGLSPRNNVRSIMRYDESQLLVLFSEAMSETPLWLFQPEGAQWRPLPVPAASGRDIKGATALRHQDKIWVAFVGEGLYELDLTTQTWRPSGRFATGSQPRFIQNIFVDRQNRLWLSDLYQGVFLLAQDGAVQQNFHRDSTPALTSNWARAVVEDRHGDFWIATNSGLNKLSRDFNNLRSYTTTQGLQSDSIYGIAEDQDGDIWFSTNDGLHTVISNSQQLIHFSVADGLQGREFNTGAFLTGIQQDIFFGGTDGLNRLWPAQLKNHPPVQTTLLLTDLHLLNQRVSPGQQYQDFVLPQQLQFQQQLQLSHQQQIFRLDFATLEFLKPEYIRYRYRLAGLSDEWLETRQNSLTFSGLAAGDYLLQIQSTTATDWNTPASRQLAIRINPPWWQHHAAYFAYLLLLLLLLLSLYWLRLAALRRQTQLLQRAVDMRTAELKQALLEKDHVFNHVSHEFRTPLTLIDGAVAELERRDTKASDQPVLQLIRYQGRYLLRLVNQLLAGQTAVNSTQTAHQPVAVSRLAAALCRDFSILAQQKNIRLQYQTDDDLQVAADPEDLTVIFNNLLSNAIKYTPAGGDIQLTLRRRPDSWLQIEASDTGCGIAEAEQPFIWDYFYRAANNQGTPAGSGIGLALVSTLVRKYQGKVSYLTKPEGGSVFQIELPLLGELLPPLITKECQPAQPAPPHTQLELAMLSEPAPAFAAATTAESGARTLLLVEDNPALRQYLVAGLSADYRCLEASNGLEALAILEDEVTDLIISDLMMPQMDGFTFCEQVKSDIATSHIPLILLTASSDQQNRLKGLQQRANLYLNKPFDMAELKLYVENFLWQLKALKALYQHSTATATEAATVTQPATQLAAEQQFLQQLQQVLEQQYQQHDFQPAALASALAISERQLQRKLKALAQMTPGLYIRQFRLHKSRQLLAQGLPAGQVAYSCGFTSQAYFTKCFKEAFGETPGQFRC